MPDPQQPVHETRPVHADPWRAFVTLGGGATVAVFFLAWLIGDQYNSACNGTGDPSSGPHSGTQCAQANQGFILLVVLGCALFMTWGLSLHRSTVTITSTGINRRYLVRTREIPWESIRWIETKFVSTNSGGLNGVAERSLALDKLWRVIAHTDTDGRGRGIVLLEFRDESAARAWASGLSAWIGTYPRPPGSGETSQPL